MNYKIEYTDQDGSKHSIKIDDVSNEEEAREEAEEALEGILFTIDYVGEI